MTIQEIKAIQISNFLASKGYEPINRKGNKWWYLSPLHTEKTASFKVDLTKNVWYDFALGKGGNIIDLAMQLYHTQNISEVLHMMGRSIILPTIPIQSTCPQKHTSFEDIEVKELAHPALLQYLLGRGIGSITAKRQCVEIHYKSAGKRYFAIGFKNDAGGYELRNPYFKGCIAPKAITTIRNHETACHIFEGFVDYLSYLILHGECDAVVLNSIVNIPSALSMLNKYSQICCHLDNDKAGRMATWQIMKALENPLKVAPLIQSNLTPVKFFHSFILFILVFFVFFLSVMPGSTLNFVYKYNDSFLLLHLRSDSPKSSIRIA